MNHPAGRSSAPPDNRRERQKGHQNPPEVFPVKALDHTEVIFCVTFTSIDRARSAYGSIHTQITVVLFGERKMIFLVMQIQDMSASCIDDSTKSAACSERTRPLQLDVKVRSIDHVEIGRMLRSDNGVTLVAIDQQARDRTARGASKPTSPHTSASPPPSVNSSPRSRPRQPRRPRLRPRTRPRPTTSCRAAPCESI